MIAIVSYKELIILCVNLKAIIHAKRVSIILHLCSLLHLNEMLNKTVFFKNHCITPSHLLGIMLIHICHNLEPPTRQPRYNAGGWDPLTRTAL